jgi:hypothetical protein
MAPIDLELAWSGCRLSAGRFQNLVVRQFRARFSTWTPGDLRRHPVASAAFCERVRAAAGAAALPDGLILEVLLRASSTGQRRVSA